MFSRMGFSMKLHWVILIIITDNLFVLKMVIYILYYIIPSAFKASTDEFLYVSGGAPPAEGG